MLELTRINADLEKSPDHSLMEWQPITSAPFDRDLELAVIEGGEISALVFPCRRVLRGWVKAKTDMTVNVHPTHWREWDNSVSPLFGRSYS